MAKLLKQSSPVRFQAKSHIHDPSNIVVLKSNFTYMTRVFTILCLVSLGSPLILGAQDSKALADAEHYFSVRSYDVALPKFVAAIQAGEKDPMVHYKTA